MLGIDLENFNYRLFLRSRRNLVLAVLVALLSVGVLVLVLIPQIQRVMSLYSQLNRENQDIVKLRQKAAALNAIETDPIYQKQASIERILPSRKAISELLASLRYIADMHSVSLQDIDLNPGLLATGSAQQAQRQAAPTAKARIAGVEQLAIKLKVQGSRENINAFLSRVNQIIPLTSVTEMKLQSAAGRASGFDTSNFESEIELTTYYFNSFIAVSADSPLPAIGDEEIKVLGQLDSFLDPQFIRPKDITGGGINDLFGEDVLPLSE